MEVSVKITQEKIVSLLVLALLVGCGTKKEGSSNAASSSPTSSSLPSELTAASKEIDVSWIDWGEDKGNPDEDADNIKKIRDVATYKEQNVCVVVQSEDDFIRYLGIKIHELNPMTGKVEEIYYRDKPFVEVLESVFIEKEDTKEHLFFLKGEILPIAIVATDIAELRKNNLNSKAEEAEKLAKLLYSPYASLSIDPRYRNIPYNSVFAAMLPGLWDGASQDFDWGSTAIDSPLRQYYPSRAKGYFKWTRNLRANKDKEVAQLVRRSFQMKVVFNQVSGAPVASLNGVNIVVRAEGNRTRKDVDGTAITYPATLENFIVCRDKILKAQTRDQESVLNHIDLTLPGS